MGRIIETLKRLCRDSRIHGGLIFVVVSLTFSGFFYGLMSYIEGSWIGIIIGAIILKLQFSWKALSEHALPIAKFLKRDDSKGARKKLSLIVGRDTRELDGKHVVSATVESIGESSVDGILSPLFYYLVFGSLFGVAIGISASVFFRAVNTLDSMIGYSKEGYANLGFFSAKADDLLNFIPARIGAFLIIIASLILKENWRNGIKIFLRDRKNTLSPNSGQVMAAVAGALNVSLEKIGFYQLGDANNELNIEHIYRSLNIVNLTTILFTAFSVLFIL
jgi:adenosylcobinamide-phosphate synthase